VLSNGGSGTQRIEMRVKMVDLEEGFDGRMINLLAHFYFSQARARVHAYVRDSSRTRCERADPAVNSRWRFPHSPRVSLGTFSLSNRIGMFPYPHMKHTEEPVTAMSSLMPASAVEEIAM
jgi:hypothetical protein